MPKKIDTPMIVARYGDKIAGWVGNEDGGMLYGDKEWVENAKAVAASGLEFTLYEDVALKADIDDPQNAAGAFAALAWFPKERIRIIKAPEGMMESLGLLDTPAEYTGEDWPENFTEEDKEFFETHLRVEIDDDIVYLPLASLKTDNYAPSNLTRVLADAVAEKQASLKADAQGEPENESEAK